MWGSGQWCEWSHILTATLRAWKILAVEPKKLPCGVDLTRQWSLMIFLTYLKLTFDLCETFMEIKRSVKIHTAWDPEPWLGAVSEEKTDTQTHVEWRWDQVGYSSWHLSNLEPRSTRRVGCSGHQHPGTGSAVAHRSVNTHAQPPYSDSRGKLCRSSLIWPM